MRADSMDFGACISGWTGPLSAAMKTGHGGYATTNTTSSRNRVAVEKREARDDRTVLRPARPRHYRLDTAGDPAGGSSKMSALPRSRAHARHRRQLFRGRRRLAARKHRGALD